MKLKSKLKSMRQRQIAEPKKKRSRKHTETEDVENKVDEKNTEQVESAVLKSNIPAQVNNNLTRIRDTLVQEMQGLPDTIKEWLFGGRTKEPQEVSRMINDISNKITVCLGVINVRVLESILFRLTYLRRIEDMLCKPARLHAMDAAEMLKEYKLISDAVARDMEFIRKFIYQNKELFDEFSKANDIAEKLKYFDTETLRELETLLGSVLEAKRRGLKKTDKNVVFDKKTVNIIEDK